MNERCGNCGKYILRDDRKGYFCSRLGTDRYHQDNHTPNPYSCACKDWEETKTKKEE